MASLPSLPAASSSEPAYIHKLPTELLQRISDYIPEDAPNLRLVDKSFKGIGLYTTIKQHNVLYLDISIASLARFREICANKEYAAKIKTICYVATVHDFEAEELPESLCGVMDSGLFSDEIVEQWIENYAHRTAEQKAIVERGDVEKELMQAMEALTSLQTVIFTPLEPSCKDKSTALNWNSSWLCLGKYVDDQPYWTLNASKSGRDQSSHKPSTDDGHKQERRATYQDYSFRCRGYIDCPAPYPRTKESQLRFDTHQLKYLDAGARMRCRSSCTSPNSLVKAIARHAELHASAPLNLEFSGITLLQLGADWQTFMSNNHGMFQKAMKHLQSIRVSVECSKEYYCEYSTEEYEDSIRRDIKRAARNSWAPIFRNASHLQSIEITTAEALDADLPSLVGTFLNETFPSLRNFRIAHTDEEWQDPCPRPGWETPAYTERDLSNFITRHASTLRSLYLRQAMPLGQLRKTDRSGLCDLLHNIKTHCRDLREATILEIWEERNDSEVEERTYREAAWIAEEISNTKASVLGRLALRLGVEPEIKYHCVRVVMAFDFGKWVMGTLPERAVVEVMEDDGFELRKAEMVGYDYVPLKMNELEMEMLWYRGLEPSE